MESPALFNSWRAWNIPSKYLLLKFDGNSKEEITKYYDDVAQICLEQGAIDLLIADTEEGSNPVWKTRGAFLEAIKGNTTMMDEVDVVVPRNRVNDFVEFVYALREEIGIRIKSFGHAGDGNLHVYILRDDLSENKWQELMNTAMNRMYEKAKELKGQISGEHGFRVPKTLRSMKLKNSLSNGLWLNKLIDLAFKKIIKFPMTKSKPPCTGKNFFVSKVSGVKND